MIRPVKPQPQRGSLLLLVDAAIREAAAADGILVPHLWPEHAPLFLLEVPDKDWVEPLQELLHKSGARVWICASYADDPVGGQDMFVYAQLGLGKSVWIASQGDKVPDLVRRVTDHHVVIRGLTSGAIAKAAGVLTGAALLVGDADWAGLGLIDVASALQDVPRATEVITRLHRMRHLTGPPIPE